MNISTRGVASLVSRIKSVVSLLTIVSGLFLSSTLAIAAIKESATELIAAHQQTLADQGAYYYQGFSLSGPVQFEFMFASDYAAQAVIIDQSQLDSFLQGSTVASYAIFDNDYGIKRVTLEEGKYAVAVRNTLNIENTMSLELNYADLSLEGYEYESTDIANTRAVEVGSAVIQSFTVEEGYKYHVDGLNTGLKSYVIPASDVDNFKSGNRFSYFGEYSSDEPNGAQPGEMTLNLDPGQYALIFLNHSDSEKKVTYRFMKFKQIPTVLEREYVDAVFNSIEATYPGFFPVETRNERHGEYYFRVYVLESGRRTYMMERGGELWYSVDDSGWARWGLISDWVL